MVQVDSVFTVRFGHWFLKKRVKGLRIVSKSILGAVPLKLAHSAIGRARFAESSGMLTPQPAAEMTRQSLLGDSGRTVVVSPASGGTST